MKDVWVLCGICGAIFKLEEGTYEPPNNFLPIAQVKCPACEGLPNALEMVTDDETC